MKRFATHITKSTPDSTKCKKHMEESMDTFMDKICTAQTRPVVRDWILVEPE
jgi:hypothetical protein